MSLQLLVEDRLCKGRFIGYFDHAVQVFYKHELRSMAELFGCVGGSLGSSFCLAYEAKGFHSLLSFDILTRPPPGLELFFDSKSSFKLARSVALSSFALVAFTSVAHALPNGYQSVAGNVQFAQAGNTLNVSTQAARSIANYQSFNVAQGETVNFNLPSAQSVILNRVIGPNSPSQIFGAMNSNGQVFLTNPSGIIFGLTAQVNVGALHASTLGISDTDFLNGQYVFKQDPNLAPASVINQGSIQTQPGGYVVFSGGAIENSGNIYAPKGQINLAVGNQVTMTVDNNLAVNVTVDDTLKQKVDGVQDAIHNSGTLQANGGLVKAQVALEKGLYDMAVNNQGIVMAEGLDMKEGEIAFIANPGSDTQVANSGVMDARGSNTAPNGGKITMEGDTAINSGIMTASSGQYGVGGTIEVLGDKVAQQGASLVDVSGDLGGGTALIGGDTHGEGNVRRAVYNYVSPDSVILADAGTVGDGGKVVVWADNTTRYYGTISAQSGFFGGKGGFTEVSGKGYLDFNGNVNLMAADGTKGTLLLDPQDIDIMPFNVLDPTLNPYVMFDANDTNAGGNGASFSTWYNMVNGSNNAVMNYGANQATWYSNAINGHPGVLFNGGGDYYNFDISGLNNSDYTIFAQAALHFSIPLVNYTDNYFLGVHGTAYNGTIQDGWADNTTMVVDPNTGSPLYASGGVPGPDVYGTFSTTLNGSGRTYTVNGAASSSDGYNTRFTNLPGTYVDSNGQTVFAGRLGKGNANESAGENNWFPGYLSQLIIYKKSLSTGERQLVEQNMAVEWGTPSGNPLSAYSTISQSYLEYLSKTTNIALAATGNITIHSMSGGVLNLQGSSSLSLTTTTGNIVMQNLADTIRTEGGTINLNAGGSITMGNLNTTGVGGGKSANISLTAAGGDVAVYSVTTGGGNFSVSAKNNAIINGAVNTNGGWVNIRADSTGINNGNVVINAPITTNNGNITLTGAGMIIGQTLNAGMGSIFLYPSFGKLIDVATGNTDNADNAGAIDISSTEISRLTAANLTIGTTGLGGNFSLLGDLNVGSGTAYDSFNLFFNTGGNYNANMHNIFANPTSKSVTITALGTVNTGNIWGGSSSAVNVSAGGTLTVDGQVNDSGTGTILLQTGNNSNILLNNFVIGGATTTVTAGGSGNLAQGGGYVAGNTVVLSSGSGSMYGTTTANPLYTQTNTLSANTGGSGNIYIYNNQAGNLTLNASSAGGDFTLYNSLGNVNVTGAVSGKTATITTPFGITANNTIHSTNGDITLTADTDHSGADILALNAAVSSTNGNIALSGPAVKINASVNAGAKNITITPTQSEAVHVGGAVNDADVPGSVLDISNPELGQMTAGKVIIGDQTYTNNFTVTGNVDVSGAGPAKAYNMDFYSGGNYSATGRTITLGTKALNVYALGTANTGTVTGAVTTVNISSAGLLTADGPVTVTGNGTVTLQTSNNASIALGANVGGGITTLITANGSGNITQSAGLVSGNTATLTSGTGNIGTSASKIQLAPTTLFANTLGNTYVNDVGNLTMNTSSAGNNNTFTATAAGNITTIGTVTTGGTGILTIATTNNGNIALGANVGGGDTTIISANNSGNITQTAGLVSGNTVTLTSGTGTIGSSSTSRIQLASTTLLANTQGSVYVNDVSNLTLDTSSAGNNGTFMANANGNLNNIGTVTTSGNGIINLTTASNGNIALGANVGGGNTTTINANGSGNITQSAGLVSGNTATLTSGTGTIGSSSTSRIQLASTTLLANTQGSVYVNDVSNLTLGASSAGINQSFMASAAGDLNNIGTVTTSGNGIINLSTTNNGNIALGANVGGGNTTTASANGSGNITQSAGLVSGNTVTLTSGTGTIGSSSTSRIQLASTTLLANTQGSVYVNDVSNLTLGASSAGINQSFMASAAGDLNNIGTVTTSGNGIINLSTTNNGNIALGANVGGGNTTTASANGSGNITQTVGLVSGNTVTLTSGTGTIGSSSTSRIQLASTTLLANTQGSVYVNDVSNLTLGASSAGNNGTFMANANGDLNNIGTVTTSGNGIINLTTASNGNIALGANVGGGNTTTINANGSGNITQSAGLVSGNTATLTSGTGNIGTSANKIQLAPTTLFANTQGNAYVNDVGNLTINTSSAGNNGSFIASANGDMTQIGNITTTGTGLVSLFTTGGGNILTNAGTNINTGNGAVNVNASAEFSLSGNISAGTGNVTLQTADTGGGSHISTITGTVNGGTVNINDSTGSSTFSLMGSVTGSSVTASAKNSIYEGPAASVSAGNGALHLTADSDNSGGGILSIGGTIAGNQSIALQGSQVLLNHSENVASAPVTILSTDTDPLLKGISINGALTTTGNVSMNTSVNGDIALNANVSAGTTNSLVANGSGNITQSAGLVSASTVTLSSGSGNIGTSSSRIQMTPTTLFATTTGNVYVNDTGNMTVGASNAGSNASFIASAAGDLNTIGDVTTGATGTVTLSTTNSGNINLGSNTWGGHTTTISANGTGNITQTSGLVTGDAVTLTSGSGNVGTSTSQIQLSQSTLFANTQGSVYVNGISDLTVSTSSAGSNANFFASAQANLSTINSLTAGDGTTVTLQANNNLSVGGSLSASNAPVFLTADNNSQNNGNLTVNAPVTDTNGFLYLKAGQMDINQSLTAFSIRVTPSVDKAIHWGGGTEHMDSSQFVDISSRELSFMQTKFLNLGSKESTSGVTLTGDIASLPMNVTIDTSGDYVASGHSVNLSDKLLSVNADGSIATGSVTGGATVLSLNAGQGMTVDGPISLSLSGSNANLVALNKDMNVRGLVTSDYVLLNAGGSILNANASSNILANSSATMRAQGWIGTIDNPIQATVTHGLLAVDAKGELNGISANVKGSVASNFLTVYNDPPGDVLFNGGLRTFGTGFSLLKSENTLYEPTINQQYQTNNAYVEERLIENNILSPDSSQLITQSIDTPTLPGSEQTRAISNNNLVMVEVLQARSAPAAPLQTTTASGDSAPSSASVRPANIPEGNTTSSTPANPAQIQATETPPATDTPPKRHPPARLW